jgi:hypothetical protein
MKKIDVWVIILGLSISVFFVPLLFQGKIPIAADTIVGLYHPFRDLYIKDYPRGIPFKNFLVTDPVRQQYPWRFLGVNLWKHMQLPLWNPYNFSGGPLLSNVQSAVFYPLNIMFFTFPFSIAWSLLVVLQPLLAGVFLYLYLRYKNIERIPSFLGSIVFAFSGFSIAWMEWNTILHVALWLPIILLAQEKLFKEKSIKWIVIFIFAQCSAFFAGHLQTFFYIFLIQILYLIARIIQISKLEKQKIILRKSFLFIMLGAVVVIITSIQWIPTLQHIFLSARDIDLNWQKEGWFLPWQHLIQFIAPDFFGNPSCTFWASFRRTASMSP